MKVKICLIILSFLLLPGMALCAVFDFSGADLKTVIRALATVCNMNVILADDVQGKVTARIEGEPEDVLRAVLTAYGLRSVKRGETYVILSGKGKEEEKREERILSTKTLKVSFADPAQIATLLKAQFPDVNVSSIRELQSLTVTAPPELFPSIENFVRENERPPRQVQIEAKIVQASSNFARELGIKWGGSYRIDYKNEITGGKDYGSSSSASSFTADTGEVGSRGGEAFPYALNLPVNTPYFSLGLFVGRVEDTLKLDVQLSALEKEGKGRIVSSPKVITVEGRPARISQGKSVPYQTVSQSGTQTQFVDAVLSVDVTPAVANDLIRLKIKVTKNQPDFSTPTPAGPPIEKREIETEAMVKSGETVVLGGIMEETESGSIEGVPLLKDIPLFGHLFRKSTRGSDRTELLVFVTPVLIEERR
jgi:type IV pilus assembly protein PilQ